MFEILHCWLFVSRQVDALITYYRNMRYSDFGHCQLHTNKIVYIHPFRMTGYDLYRIFKDSIISIACVSCAGILNDFGIPLLHTCISIMYVGYISCPFSMGL